MQIVIYSFAAARQCWYSPKKT